MYRLASLLVERQSGHRDPEEAPSCTGDAEFGVGYLMGSYAEVVAFGACVALCIWLYGIYLMQWIRSFP